VVVGRGVVLREGTDAALLALGSMVPMAQEAAEALAARGHQVAVVNARFLKPLDTALVTRLAEETGLLVTLEENVRAGGFGSAVAEHLADEELDCTLLRLGLPDEFIEQGERTELLATLGLDAAGVAHQVEQELAARDA
jgi:1-deoxy-D-xylulose-5-phosphate synthase